MRAALLVLVAGCSVPAVELDGKQCGKNGSCVDGYACDLMTNLCHPANGDGGVVDSPSTTSCLTPSITPELYRYDGMFDWTRQGGSWSGGAQITQNSSMVMETFAFEPRMDLATGSYHVIAALKPGTTTGNSPRIGIVLRAQGEGDLSRYECNWLPKTSELRLEIGGPAGLTPLRMVRTGTITTSSVTMEASITGAPATISCCLREAPMSKLMNVADPAGTISDGSPGLATDRMSGTFPSFVVYAP